MRAQGRSCRREVGSCDVLVVVWFGEYNVLSNSGEKGRRGLMAISKCNAVSSAKLGKPGGT
jgi:hypothetical protein